ncbi:small intestine aquaporin [Lynx pardinus]|uniref:Small intestine aquaporin n=1 Tax=Lynx pardinus TaxID=191816 RepID=A0A485MGQ2_LYNPA|nr:small intestine aquaporin [Lynx pardinus]
MFLAGSLAVTIAIYVGGNVSDALQNHTGGNLTVTGPKETASLFATYPAPYLSLNNGFLDQVGVRGRPGKAPVFALVPWAPRLLVVRALGGIWG